MLCQQTPHVALLSSLFLVDPHFPETTSFELRSSSTGILLIGCTLLFLTVGTSEEDFSAFLAFFLIFLRDSLTVFDISGSESDLVFSDCK